MTAPRTFQKFAADHRDDSLAAEMAKIRLLEQVVANLDDLNETARYAERDRQ